MSNKLRADEIKEYFGTKPFTNDELYKYYMKQEPGLKKTTFRWRVYKLKKIGVINNLKRGIYVTKRKKEFEPVIGKKLSDIFKKTRKQFPYSDASIWDTSWLKNYTIHQPFLNNIILETDKDAAPAVFAYLQESYKDVYLNPGEYEVNTYIISGQNNLIVKNLNKSSPLKEREGIIIPAIEKILVDLFVDNELFVTYQGAELQNVYRELFRIFNINQSTLKQYANKRHARDKLIHFLRAETEINNDELLI